MPIKGPSPSFNRTAPHPGDTPIPHPVWTSLCLAYERGAGTEAKKKLIDEGGFDVNTPIHGQETALDLAVRKNDMALATHLLMKGATPGSASIIRFCNNKDMLDLLHFAAQKNKLYPKGSDIFTDLDRALQSLNRQDAKKLLTERMNKMFPELDRGQKEKVTQEDYDKAIQARKAFWSNAVTENKQDVLRAMALTSPSFLLRELPREKLAENTPSTKALKEVMEERMKEEPYLLSKHGAVANLNGKVSMPATPTEKFWCKHFSAYRAMQRGEALDKKFDVSLANVGNGLPGLSTALAHGDVQAIKAYGELLALAPKKDQAAFLASHTQDISRALMTALSDGHAEAAGAYADMVKQIAPALDAQQRRALLTEIKASHTDPVFNFFFKDNYKALIDKTPGADNEKATFYRQFEEMKRALESQAPARLS